jgi:hypothetical protein
VRSETSDFEHAYRLLLPDGRARSTPWLTRQDASGNRRICRAR